MTRSRLVLGVVLLSVWPGAIGCDASEPRVVDEVSPAPVGRAESEPSVTAPPPSAPAREVVWASIPAGQVERHESREGTGPGPAPVVRISRPFELRATEVTEGSWQALMGNNPTHATGLPDEACPGRSDCPVNEVTWWDALAYANRLSEQSGLTRCYDLSACEGNPGETSFRCPALANPDPECTGYRLPTEDEWEYAARAGSTTPYPCGDDSTCLLEREILNGSPRARGASSMPVASRPPNAWGLHDMLGNVSEWVWDGYAPYGEEPGSDPAGAPGPPRLRVFRGGSFVVTSRDADPGQRSGVAPDLRYRALGFRLARTLAQ